MAELLVRFGNNPVDSLPIFVFRLSSFIWPHEFVLGLILDFPGNMHNPNAELGGPFSSRSANTTYAFGSFSNLYFAVYLTIRPDFPFKEPGDKEKGALRDNRNRSRQTGLEPQ
jgi:hypothetical protein